MWSLATLRRTRGGHNQNHRRPSQERRHPKSFLAMTRALFCKWACTVVGKTGVHRPRHLLVSCHHVKNISIVDLTSLTCELNGKCYAINLLHASSLNHGLPENHPLGRKGVLSEGGRFVQLCREDGRWGLVGRSRGRQSGRAVVFTAVLGRDLRALRYDSQHE